VERDTLFVSCRIRLQYNSHTTVIDAVKDGIFSEAGVDNVTPDSKICISSWAYDRAVHNDIDIIDDRAIDVV